MSLRPVVELAAAALGEMGKQFNDNDVGANRGSHDLLAGDLGHFGGPVLRTVETTIC